MKVAPRHGRPPDAGTRAAVEVSIVMPCLNEAETIARCIQQAQRAAEKLGISAEVIVADNGSTDGSAVIARELGARVVEVARKGYGAALIGGIEAAGGEPLVMGDADCSYDFGAIARFARGAAVGVTCASCCCSAPAGCFSIPVWLCLFSAPCCRPC